MTATTIELPQAISLDEGKSLDVNIRLIARHGRLVVQSMTADDQCENGGVNAVDDFLAFAARLPPGPLSNATDEEIDDARLQYLKEKHLR